MLRVISTQSSPAALAASLHARDLVARMRAALSDLSDVELDAPALRCISYAYAGVPRDDAFRLDDAALRSERLRRANVAPRPATVRSSFLAAAAACTGGAA